MPTANELTDFLYRLFDDKNEMYSTSYSMSSKVYFHHKTIGTLTKWIDRVYIKVIDRSLEFDMEWTKWLWIDP